MTKKKTKYILKDYEFNSTPGLYVITSYQNSTYFRGYSLIISKYITDYASTHSWENNKK